MTGEVIFGIIYLIFAVTMILIKLFGKYVIAFIVYKASKDPMKKYIGMMDYADFRHYHIYKKD